MGDDSHLFKGKYRIPSARLKGWDYSSEGWYYLTICTYNRWCLFGDIHDHTMRLNNLGEIVQAEWENSFQIRKELICDSYIIMPNHIHGLVGISKPHDDDVEAHGRAPLHHHPHDHHHNPDQRWEECPPGQPPKPSLPSRDKSFRPMPQRTPRSISSFVAGFKSAATKRINEIRNTPGQPVWQTRFYDRIVWSEKEFYAIQRYIKENPERLWIKMNDKERMLIKRNLR